MSPGNSAVLRSRRRWQFSLRALFVVFLLGGLWLGMTASRIRRQRAAVEAIRSLGGSVVYSLPGDGEVEKFVARLLGQDAVDKVIQVYLGATSATDDDLKCLANLTDLETLSLVHTHVTDAGLHQLEHLRSLKTLDLRFSGVTFAGAERLQSVLPSTRIYLRSDIE